ncbi:MAG: FecR domain-containing protein [Syntrophales bacterium]|jgi:hypothetical protein|nr:FecR domain-containing protein [Syntrophales bacterium]MDY0044268.1 FecR domain-containing protein [Syntrophales bacterium]
MKKMFLFVLSFSVLLMMPFSVFASGIGKFTSISGMTDITRADEKARPAKVGDEVIIGDFIRTKSNAKAEITFIDGSVTRLAQRSRIRITEYFLGEKGRKSVIDLFRGKVQSVVQKSEQIGKNDRYEVHTPTAVCGVRGTIFFTYFQDGVSGGATSEGSVYVYSKNRPGDVKTMAAGEAMIVTSPDQPPVVRPATAAEMKQLGDETSTEDDKDSDSESNESGDEDASKNGEESDDAADDSSGQSDDTSSDGAESDETASDDGASSDSEGGEQETGIQETAGSDTSGGSDNESVTGSAQTSDNQTASDGTQSQMIEETASLTILTGDDLTSELSGTGSDVTQVTQTVDEPTTNSVLNDVNTTIENKAPESEDPDDTQSEPTLDPLPVTLTFSGTGSYDYGNITVASTFEETKTAGIITVTGTSYDYPVWSAPITSSTNNGGLSMGYFSGVTGSWRGLMSTLYLNNGVLGYMFGNPIGEFNYQNYGFSGQGNVLMTPMTSSRLSPSVFAANLSDINSNASVLLSGIPYPDLGTISFDGSSSSEGVSKVSAIGMETSALGGMILGVWSSETAGGFYSNTAARDLGDIRFGAVSDYEYEYYLIGGIDPVRSIGDDKNGHIDLYGYATYMDTGYIGIIDLRHLGVYDTNPGTYNSITAGTATLYPLDFSGYIGGPVMVGPYDLAGARSLYCNGQGVLSLAAHETGIFGGRTSPWSSASGTGTEEQPGYFRALGDYFDPELYGSPTCKAPYVWNTMSSFMTADGESESFIVGLWKEDGTIIAKSIGLYQRTDGTTGIMRSNQITGNYYSEIGTGMWMIQGTLTPDPFLKGIYAETIPGIEQLSGSIQSVFSDGSCISGSAVGSSVHLFYGDDTSVPFGIYNLQFGAVQDYRTLMYMPNSFYSATGDAESMSGRKIGFGGYAYNPDYLQPAQLGFGEETLLFGAIIDTIWEAGTITGSMWGEYLSDAEMGTFEGPFYGLYDVLEGGYDGTWSGAGAGAYQGEPLAFSGSWGGCSYYEACANSLYTPASFDQYGEALYPQGEEYGKIGLAARESGSYKMLAIGNFYSYDDGSAPYMWSTPISMHISDPDGCMEFYSGITGYTAGIWKDGNIAGYAVSLLAQHNSQSQLTDLELVSGALTGEYNSGLSMWKASGTVESTLRQAGIDPQQLYLDYGCLDEFILSGHFTTGGLIEAESMSGSSSFFGLYDSSSGNDFSFNWGVYGITMAGTSTNPQTDTSFLAEIGGWGEFGYDNRYGSESGYLDGYWMATVSGMWNTDGTIAGTLGKTGLDDGTYGMFMTLRGIGTLSGPFCGLYNSTDGIWVGASAGSFEVETEFDYSAFWDGSLYYSDGGYFETSGYQYGIAGLVSSGDQFELHAMGEFYDYGYGGYGGHLWSTALEPLQFDGCMSENASSGGFGGFAGGIVRGNSMSGYAATLFAHLNPDGTSCSIGLLTGHVTGNQYNPFDIFYAQGTLDRTILESDIPFSPEMELSSNWGEMYNISLSSEFSSQNGMSGDCSYGSTAYYTLCNTVTSQQLSRPFGIYEFKINGGYENPDAAPSFAAVIGGYGGFGTYYDGTTWYNQNGYFMASVSGSWADGSVRGIIGESEEIDGSYGFYLTDAHMGRIYGQFYGLYPDTETAGIWSAESVGVFTGSPLDYGGVWGCGIGSLYANVDGYATWAGDENGKFGLVEKEGVFDFLAMGHYSESPGYGGSYIWSTPISGSQMSQPDSAMDEIFGYTGGIWNSEILNGAVAALFIDREASLCGTLRGRVEGKYHSSLQSWYAHGVLTPVTVAGDIEPAGISGEYMSTSVLDCDGEYFISGYGEGERSFFTDSEGHELPWGIYSLSVGGGEFNSSSNGPSFLVEKSLRISQSGYESDKSYWLGNLVFTGVMDGEIEGAISGRYMSLTHMGQFTGPFFGLYDLDQSGCGEGTWIGEGVGIYAGSPLSHVSRIYTPVLHLHRHYAGQYNYDGGGYYHYEFNIDGSPLYPDGAHVCTYDGRPNAYAGIDSTQVFYYPDGTISRVIHTWNPALNEGAGGFDIAEDSGTWDPVAFDPAVLKTPPSDAPEYTLYFEEDNFGEYFTENTMPSEMAGYLGGTESIWTIDPVTDPDAALSSSQKAPVTAMGNYQNFGQSLTSIWMSEVVSENSYAQTYTTYEDASGNTGAYMGLIAGIHHHGNLKGNLIGLYVDSDGYGGYLRGTLEGAAYKDVHMFEMDGFLTRNPVTYVGIAPQDLIMNELFHSSSEGEFKVSGSLGSNGIIMTGAPDYLYYSGYFQSASLVYESTTGAPPAGSWGVYSAVMGGIFENPDAATRFTSEAGGFAGFGTICTADGYGGFTYIPDEGYWLGSLGGVWENGKIEGILTGEFMTHTKMGALSGDILGTYSGISTGAWEAVSTGTFEKTIDLAHMSILTAQIGRAISDPCFGIITEGGLTGIFGGDTSLWDNSPNISITAMGSISDSADCIWYQDGLTSLNAYTQDSTTYRGGAYYGTLSGIKQHNDLTGSLFALYVDGNGGAGYLAGELGGRIHESIGIYKMDGSVERIVMNEAVTGVDETLFRQSLTFDDAFFSGAGSFSEGGFIEEKAGYGCGYTVSIAGEEWGAWASSLFGTFQGPASEQWVMELVEVVNPSPVGTNQWIEISGSKFSSNEMEGTAAGAWINWDQAVTGISGGTLKGTFDPDAFTWEAVAKGAMIETNRFQQMAGINPSTNEQNLAAVDITKLQQLNIPCIRVGTTDLTGSDGNLTVNMNNVNFFSYSTGASPKIWTTSNVNGSFNSLPAAGSTAILNGAGFDHSVNFKVQRWDGVHSGNWAADVMGAGTVSGHNVSMTGAAAGVISAPNQFTGAGAGVSHSLPAGGTPSGAN